MRIDHLTDKSKATLNAAVPDLLAASVAVVVALLEETAGKLSETQQSEFTRLVYAAIAEIKGETKPHICLKCGYQWEPRKENPKACPDCKTRNWNK